MKGSVVRINKEKLFGFIKGDDGRDYFFHTSAVTNKDWFEIKEGNKVEFMERNSPKGLRAEQVFFE